MIFEDTFTVPVPPERAWELLNDVPGVAPCFPGAELTEATGDTYRGTVRIKVGPMLAEYAGTAAMLSRDASARRVVIEAKGTEKRGAGLATATVTASLAAAAEGTQVHVHTDLRVTGRLAQFGSAVLAPVSAGLLAQFAANLRDQLDAGGSDREQDDPRPGGAAAQPLDVAALVRSSPAMRRRAGLAAAGVALTSVIAFVIVWWRRHD